MTVVLAMVLVPIMVVTGLFVDGSRGVLARSVVRSAQQVAMNDVLANHDEMLRKTFGLLAVIDSENLDVAAQQVLASSTSVEGGGDILRLEFSSAEFGDVEVVANANLAEPDVLTNQIVEYMKYRAPVEFMSSLAESINWLVNLEKKITLVKKRVDGINKLAKVVDEAEKLIDEVAAIKTDLIAAYDALKKVEDLVAESGADSIEQRFADLASAYFARELDSTAQTRQAYDDALDRVLAIWTLIRDAADKSSDASTKLLAVDPTDLVTAASDLITFVDEELTPAAEADAAASQGADDDAADAQEDASFLKSTGQKIKKAITDEFSAEDRKEITDALDRFVRDSKTILAKEYTRSKITSMISTAVGDARTAYEEANEDEDGEDPSAAAVTSILEDARDAIMKIVVQDLNGPLRELTDTMMLSGLKSFAETKLQKVAKALDEAVKKGLAEEATGQAKSSVTTMLKAMKDRALSYKELLDAVKDQRATTYSGSDDRWATRPSVGGTTDGAEAAQELAGFSDTDEEDVDAFSDDSGGLLDAVLGLVGGLLDAAENVRDGIFFTEYVTGMFTYSTLDNVSVTASQNEDQNCLWSSACAAGKKASADKKTAGDASKPDAPPESGPVSDNDPGKRLSQEAYPECWEVGCASEVEYVLTGFDRPAAVYGMISLMRYGINLVVAFSDKLVTVIRSVVATIPFLGWLAAAVPFVAALMQTFDDMARLRNGELVTFIPTELTVLRAGFDLSDEARKIGVVDDEWAATPESRETSGKRRELGEVELGYIHYLKIFMIVRWMGDREGMVRRAGDVVDFNMGYLGQDDFRLTKAGTAFTVTSGYEVQPFISTLFRGTGPADSLFEGDSGRFHLTTVGGF
ncbi:hypothetical protein GCM10011331_05930 [Flavimobilis marinus]|nr:hypothetical protein GCM10011331_05930 [Flavimobilis marinus]